MHLHWRIVSYCVCSGRALCCRRRELPLTCVHYMVPILLRRRPCKFVLARHPKLLQQSSLSSLWEAGAEAQRPNANGRRRDVAAVAIEPAES
jgi:hypothetical protein